MNPPLRFHHQDLNEYPSEYADNVQYEIDHVCYIASVGNATFYVVRWQDYGPEDNTMESKSSFNNHPINEFDKFVTNARPSLQTRKHFNMNIPNKPSLIIAGVKKHCAKCFP
jgi:hypothetical protein